MPAGINAQPAHADLFNAVWILICQSGIDICDEVGDTLSVVLHDNAALDRVAVLAHGHNAGGQFKTGQSSQSPLDTLAGGAAVLNGPDVLVWYLLSRQLLSHAQSCAL